MRGLRALAGAIAALATCLAIVKLTQLLGVVPSFPAPAGEDDFAPRAAVFFLFVCPAFAALGGWIALASTRRVALRMLAGCAVATVASFALAALGRGTIERLTTSRAANAAALTFLIGWPLLCAAAALMLRRTGSRAE